MCKDRPWGGGVLHDFKDEKGVLNIEVEKHCSKKQEQWNS